MNFFNGKMITGEIMNIENHKAKILQEVAKTRWMKHRKQRLIKNKEVRGKVSIKII